MKTAETKGTHSQQHATGETSFFDRAEESAIARIPIHLKSAKSECTATELTPQVGFEPTTNRLTADRSTTELLRKADNSGLL